ncbi:hypothetical protein MYXA107069_09675 [Myxococcus xanthus]
MHSKVAFASVVNRNTGLTTLEAPPGVPLAANSVSGRVQSTSQEYRAGVGSRFPAAS